MSEETVKESGLERLKRLRKEMKEKQAAEAGETTVEEPKEEKMAKAQETPAETPPVEEKKEVPTKEPEVTPDAGSKVSALKAKLEALRKKKEKTIEAAEEGRPETNTDSAPIEREAPPVEERTTTEAEAEEKPPWDEAGPVKPVEKVPEAETKGVPGGKRRVTVPVEINVTQTAKQGTLTVHRMYKKSGELVDDVNKSEQIEIGVFHGPTAQVSVEKAMTIQPRQYESIKVGVHVSVPTYLEEIEAAYAFAAKMTEAKIIEEMADIKRESS